MEFSRIAAVSGLAFVVLAISNGVLLGNPPFPNADLADVRAYVERDEGLHKAALFLLQMSFAFAVVFFAGVVNYLSASDREHNEAWGIASFGGAILMGSAAVVGNTLYALLVYRGGSGLDDSFLGMLKDGELIAFSAMGTGVATVAASVAIPTFRHRILPLWHGALGVVVVIFSVLGTIAMVSATDAGGWFSSIATVSLGVWVLATSVVLLRNSSAT
jgi:hypothetical protein